MYDSSSQPRMDGLVLFSGPGGSSHGLRMAGVATTGIELDQDACDTAVKMGLQSIQGNVTAHDPRQFFDRYVAGEVKRMLLLQASPPCPGFSKAGKGLGRKDLPHLQAALHDLATTRIEDAEEAALLWRQILEAECADPRSALTFEPIRWMAALHPEYIFMEQVPEVLVVWEAYAEVLEAWGYSVWTGKVYAEQYGVPQTRIRAFLIASRVSKVVPPTPTHSRYHNRTPKKLDAGVPKWVSMAEALGWGMVKRPYPSVLAGTKSGGADPMMIGGSGARKIITDAAASGDPEVWRDKDMVGHPRKDDGWRPTEVDDTAPRWDDNDQVGFPRRDDEGSRGAIIINGVAYRARDFRRGDEPAFALTEKVRSWKRYPACEACEHLQAQHDDNGRCAECGSDGSCGGFMPVAQVAAGRTGGGTPRSLDHPSPTITGKGTAMWIEDESTFQGPWAERPDGEQVSHMGDVATSRGTIRPVDEPAPGITGSLDNGNTRWFDAANPPANMAERELPWRGQVDKDAVAEQMATETVEGAPRVNNQSGTDFDLGWPAERPAPVIAGRGLVTMPGANANRFNGSTKSRNDGIRVTVQEAGVLQSFPADWSFQGSKTSQYQQVGNAVPPLLQYVLTIQQIGE